MRPLFYIHQANCISAQQTYGDTVMDNLHEPVDKKMKAIEPGYEGIPPGTLRRMGKAVRMGVGSAMPIIKETDSIDGIIIGTSNGGMEDCIKFLNQIIQYDEGLLAPGNFVQSTVNAVASQIGLFSHNKGYNITHVQRGLSFENAIIDTAMQLKENDDHNYLLGAVDEISAYNYNIDLLDKTFKEEEINSAQLFNSNTPGCIAGEGAAMFMANNHREKALAKVRAIATFHSEDPAVLEDQLAIFIEKTLSAGEKIDLLLSGENGDNRFLQYYETCEKLLGSEIAVARFKHMTGEFTTVSGPALWIACHILQQQDYPLHMQKNKLKARMINRLLIYNNYKGYQHSIMLVELP